MKLNFDRKYSVNFVPPRAERGTHGWIVVLGACLVFVKTLIGNCTTRDTKSKYFCFVDF